MFQKKVLVFWAVVFLVSASAFSWVETERVKLGVIIEGTTFITSGTLAGKVAFIDDWDIYVNDLAGGAYEKLFSVDRTLFGPSPRGIVYLSQGDYAGNFILTDINNSSKLFLVSTSGSLVNRIVAQDLSWPRCEGATQITSGPFQGDIAILCLESPNSVNYRIAIFEMDAGDGVIHAHHKGDIPLGPPPPGDYWTGITFLPDNSSYPNHFAFVGASGLIIVIDDQGVQKTTIDSAYGIEGLTYIPSGPDQGKLLIADRRGVEIAVINLEGTASRQVSIPVGLGLDEVQSLTWLKYRQQLAVLGWSRGSWKTPMALVSCPHPGSWVKDAEIVYTGLNPASMITDMTSDGTYYLQGRAENVPGYFPWEIHRLDADFQVVNKIRIPFFSNPTFGDLIYVPGSTPADDRFILVGPGEALYYFDRSFNSPTDIIDLGEKVYGIAALCYDPDVRRYYLHDAPPGGSRIQVFDQSWNLLAGYDIGRPFGNLIKITSGVFKGHLAYRSTMELVIIRFEPTDLFGQLSQAVLVSGIKSGLAKELNQQLQVALKSVKNGNIVAAVNQIRGFQASVQAQSGKGIPPDLTDAWLEGSEEIIRGLQSL